MADIWKKKLIQAWYREENVNQVGICRPKTKGIRDDSGYNERTQKMISTKATKDVKLFY